MPHLISKTFNVCYGHRVYTQSLNPVFAGKDNRCACRHLHGHNADIEVTLNTDQLDERGMVMDFKELGYFKEWLDEYLDHRFVIGANDPLIDMLYGVQWRSYLEVVPFGREGVDAGQDPLRSLWAAARLNAPSELTSGDDATSIAVQELYSGTLVVGFVPTSENLSRWIAEMLKASLPTGVRVVSVTWWETPKSKSTYIA